MAADSYLTFCQRAWLADCAGQTREWPWKVRKSRTAFVASCPREPEDVNSKSNPALGSSHRFFHLRELLFSKKKTPAPLS